jgi:hypothetical protein
MTMKTTHAISFTLALAAAAFAASTLAQDSPRPLTGTSADRLPEGQKPSVPVITSPNSFYRQGGDTVYYGTTFADPSRQPMMAEEATLNHEVATLTKQLETADSDSRRDEIKTKLNVLLGKQFDARQKRHANEIETLEARVKKLKQIVSQRQENRTEIISRRLDQIIQDSKGLGF